MYELHYTIKAYYDEKFRGLAEAFETDDFEAMRMQAHEYASQGFMLKIYNNEIGTVIEISPDSYFENFEGESPITEF